MIFDFHCHTTCSDGTLSPEALVQRAADCEVNYLSITDHDNAQAYVILQDTTLPPNLTLIPGIEFSANYKNRGVHILGLNIDPTHPIIQSAEVIQAKHRLERAAKISHKLEQLGIGTPGTLLDQVLAMANTKAIGRPHFADHLIANNYCISHDQAFKQFLGDGKPACIKQAWPELDEIVHWIKTAGGIAVIAHPDKYKMTRSRLCKFIEAFKAEGGEGFEVINARQAPHITAKLCTLAQHYDLLCSIGSDFHSPAQTWLQLGMHKYLPSACISIAKALGIPHNLATTSPRIGV